MCSANRNVPAVLQMNDELKLQDELDDFDDGVAI